MAQDYRQPHPLALGKLHRKRDEEFAASTIGPSMRTPSSYQPGRTNKCPVFCLATVVVVLLAALIFSLVVLHPTNPNFSLTEVAVKDLSYNNNDPARPWFNGSFVAQVKIKNVNFGRIDFENSTVSILYKEKLVGMKVIAPGEVEKRDAESTNFTLVVGSTGLIDPKVLRNLTSDMNARMLELWSYASLSGKVRLIKVVRRRVSSVMNCSMSLDLSSHGIQNLLCR